MLDSETKRTQLDVLEDILEATENGSGVANGLTDTQLRATPVSVSNTQLPTTLGSKLAAQSMSVTPASDSTFIVGSAQRSVATLTVASGQSLSPEIDLGTGTAARLGLPTVVTGTGPITFQVASASGGTFKDLYDQYGNIYQIPSSAANRSYALNVGDFMSIRFMKIRFGTAAAPQIQNQATEITLTMVA